VRAGATGRPPPLRIATRASALALAQAQQVAELLGGDGAPSAVELVPMVTSGDRGQAPTAQAQADKERWVKELEEALLAGEVDLAVHSAKDVPAVLPDGLILVGAPCRGDPRDALCGAASLAGLEAGARVGTSSLRRAALVNAHRDDLDVVALSGNVDTRLRRLEAGEYAAIVLASAGLERLGRGGEATSRLDAHDFVPAAGQGTLVLQARAEDDAARERVAVIAHPGTERCLRAERSLVRALEADCHTPLGAHATEEAGEAGDVRLRLRAFVGRADGSAWLRDELVGDDPRALGEAVAVRLRAAGADDVLGR